MPDFKIECEERAILETLYHINDCKGILNEFVNSKSIDSFDKDGLLHLIDRYTESAIRRAQNDIATLENVKQYGCFEIIVKSINTRLEEAEGVKKSNFSIC